MKYVRAFVIEARLRRAKSRGRWASAARGVERADESGAYFTGRHRILDDLTSWLCDPARTDPRVRVVTGGPGSGKTAILAQLVMAGDWRGESEAGDESGELALASLPLVAIDAEQLTLNDVVEQIAAALQIAVADAEDLIRMFRLARRGRIIVLDSLDEAASEREALEIIHHLVVPLARASSGPTVRVIVGTRPGPSGLFLEHLRDVSVLLDVEADEYFDSEDLAGYVRRRLLSEGSPYEADLGLADRIAHAVAALADRSFLIARVEIGWLLGLGRQLDTNAHGWEHQFSASVQAAMRKSIDLLPDRQRARDLLTPLAYAEGAEGLPERGALWAALAGALADDDYTRSDVRWLLGSRAADYLVAHGDGRTKSYRLYHRALEEFLQTGDVGTEYEVQRTYAETLRSAVPLEADGKRPDWSAAPPYVRSHLASHAAKGGVIDELLVDPGFLIVAEPTRLLRALPQAREPRAQSFGRVFAHAAEHLRAQDSTPPVRAAYLSLAAHQLGLVDLAETIDGLGIQLPWRVAWARWRAPSPHVVGWRHEGWASAVAITRVAGRAVAVSGGDDPAIAVWDPADGTPVGPPLLGSDGPVYSIAAMEHDGRSFAVSGGDDGAVRIWNLERGTPSARPCEGHGAAVYAVKVATVRGQPAVVSGGTDGLVRLWDLQTGNPIAEPLAGHSGWVLTLDVGWLAGRAVAVSGGADGSLRVWDLDRGTALHDDPLTGHTAAVSAVAIGELDGEAVIISGSEDNTLRLWGLVDGAFREEIGRHDDWIRAVDVVTQRDGSMWVASGGADKEIRMWPLSHRAGGAHHYITGHDGWVSGVAACELDGRPALVTASGDTTVRIWNVSTPLEMRGDDDLRVNAIDAGTLRGERIVATAAADASLRLWRLADGRPACEPLSGHAAAVNAIAAAPEREVMLSASDDGTVRAWDLGAGLVSPGGVHVTHPDWVRGVDVAARGADLLGASASDDGTVRIWNLERPSDQRVLGGNDDWTRSVALGVLDGEWVVAAGGHDGKIRVWRLDASDNAAPQVLRGHDGPVSALHIAPGELGLVSGGFDGSLRVWREGYQTKARGAHEGPVSSIAAMGVEWGWLIASGGEEDRSVQLWDPESDRACRLRVDANVVGVAVDVGNLLVATSHGILVITGMTRQSLAVVPRPADWNPGLASRPGPPLLRIEDRGPWVRQLQLALTKAGFPPSGIDGILGPNSEEAVKRLQHASSLKPDGVVGPVTWRTLRSAASGPRDGPRTECGGCWPPGPRSRRRG
jgi:WD40 repeat protein